MSDLMKVSSNPHVRSRVTTSNIMLAVVIALLAAGVGLFIGGFAMLFVRPFGGMICMAAGCFLIALFLVCAVLLAAVFSKFFPWLIKEVEGLGKYLSRKWAERKGKGEMA